MDVYSEWTALQDDQLDIGILSRVPDDFWVAVACLDRIVDNVAVEKTLLTTGLNRTTASLERCRQATADSLLTHFNLAPVEAQICYLRRLLLERLDRLNTFVQISQCESQTDGDASDPWDDEQEDVKTTSPPIPLVEFLTGDLLQTACSLALNQHYKALHLLFQRHSARLWPYRFFILDTIPRHVNAAQYSELLPSFDPAANSESPLVSAPWRTDLDFLETDEVTAALEAVGTPPAALAYTVKPVNHLLTSDELFNWYRQCAESILSSTGMVDMALSLIQHGAAQGVNGLDELGEELSLFSRLVYETPKHVNAIDKITLEEWRTMDPPAIVKMYLSHSTPESLPGDILRLVMPYLFVLESRAERAGKPDPSISTTILFRYILSSKLSHVAAIFDASKPTLPSSKRIIKNDEDMARLALACLYGSNSLSEWATMSSIFECLPAWETSNEEVEDVFDMTITSLGAFVAPSTSGRHATPEELLAFFQPLPLTSLSHALDVLDVHLESGEILSRWSVPVPLRWFLRSHNDVYEQRSCANKMARRAGGSEDKLTTVEDWEWLLEDMLKLRGTSENGLKGALGLLPEDEVCRIFFSGLLSTGLFDIAKHLLHSFKILRMSGSDIEELCLSCSRELYDNASSGSYKVGDMKLAYDCLSVPMPSEVIQKEKEFIEATSRLCSFNITSRPGVPITPIEIRLTKDRLSLVSRVLSNNSDAYKHTEVILDLVSKLGFKDDPVAEIKTLAMLADTALQAEDFQRAYECASRMVDTVLSLKSSQPLDDDNPHLTVAIEVCWVACFQLGRHPEFNDTKGKLSLLGRTLELCPPDRLHDVLTAWRQLERLDIESRQEKLSHAGSYRRRDKAETRSTAASSLKAHLQDFHTPSPSLLNSPDAAAALASKTFKTVAANFPFAVGRTEASQEHNELGHQRRPGGGDVSSQATRALSRGIGWLIGADDGGD